MTGQEVHRFPNGYAASIITHGGRREVAALYPIGPTLAGALHVGIPGVTDDVATVRDDAHLAELLDKIAGLP